MRVGHAGSVGFAWVSLGRTTKRCLAWDYVETRKREGTIRQGDDAGRLTGEAKSAEHPFSSFLSSLRTHHMAGVDHNSTPRLCFFLGA
jgi:hypothetical protein